MTSRSNRHNTNANNNNNNNNTGSNGTSLRRRSETSPENSHKHPHNVNNQYNEGNLEYFYEEPLDKEDYDAELIRDLFFRRRVKFTQETRMRRYFRG